MSIINLISEGNRIRTLMGLPKILEVTDLETFPVDGGKFNIGYDKNWNNFDDPIKTANSDYSLTPTYAGAGGHLEGHIGIDIFGPKGAPIVSPVDGIFTSQISSGGNKIVKIKDKNDFTHWLGHLDTIDSSLKNGDVIKAGTVVGTLGDTGNAKGTAPHLHYNVYKNTYKDGQNPFTKLRDAIGKTPDNENDLEPKSSPEFLKRMEDIKKNLQSDDVYDGPNKEKDDFEIEPPN